MKLTVGLGQTPQDPPQPSGPHVFPAHCGVQTHWPVGLQLWVPVQAPQLPPQPSGPHCLPAQLGTQAIPESVRPLGVPLPVGPSKPGAASHRMLKQAP
ncbi:MAG TPA: hypothetical protein VH208_05160, partial [Myxococcaceae bacterium]|nr:hypothetical protein [Myxococcaceae bacterium]